MRMEEDNIPEKFLNGESHDTRSVGKTNKKMEACRPEGCITDPRNTRMEATNWGERRIEAPFKGGQGLERVLVPHIA
jgi:hypothetical protein